MRLGIEWYQLDLPSPTNIYGIPSAQALARPWPPPYRAESYYARWPALRAPSWRNARMNGQVSRASGAVTTLSRRVKWGAARAPAARRGGSRRTAGRPAAGQAGLSRSENRRSEKHPSGGAVGTLMAIGGVVRHRVAVTKTACLPWPDNQLHLEHYE